MIALDFNPIETLYPNNLTNVDLSDYKLFWIQDIQFYTLQYEIINT